MSALLIVRAFFSILLHWWPTTFANRFRCLLRLFNFSCSIAAFSPSQTPTHVLSLLPTLAISLRQPWTQLQAFQRRVVSRESFGLHLFHQHDEGRPQLSTRFLLEVTERLFVPGSPLKILQAPKLSLAASSFLTLRRCLLQLRYLIGFLRRPLACDCQIQCYGRREVGLILLNILYSLWLLSLLINNSIDFLKIFRDHNL